jgi:hypothetical protein
VLVLAGVVPAAFALYNFSLALFDPFAKLWTAQNIIRSPHPLHYLIAYGLLLPFAWLGARRLLRRSPCSAWLPVIWVLLFPFLAYAPLDLQRRLTEGVWAAWCILAVASFDLEGQPDTHMNARRLAPLILAFPTTLFLLIGGGLAAWGRQSPLFLPTAQVRVFETLQSPAQQGAVVLSAYDTGNALPAWAPVYVLIGHGPESIQLAGLSLQVAAFYRSSTPDSDRLSLIESFGVDFVFWGPQERLLGEWQPDSATYLQRVAVQEGYVLYAVISTP